MNLARLCLALTLVLPSAKISPQADTSMSPAARVMQRLRAEGETGEALFVLRGFRGEWSLAQQDAVADSLASFIVSSHGDAELKARDAALLALSLSSRVEGYGTPYLGAGIRLRRVAENGAPGSLGGAMYAIVSLPDTGESLRLVEGLARYNGRAAEAAVEALESRFGERGLAALRRLSLDGGAGTQQARDQVSSLAIRRGWVAPGQPPPLVTMHDETGSPSK